MKDDFNIENLKRQNNYIAPNDFYKEVQENVLRETSLLEEEKPPKIKPLNLKWMAVAASLILVFGLGFVWLNNDADELDIVKVDFGNPTEVADENTMMEESIKIDDIAEEKEEKLTDISSEKEMVDTPEMLEIKPEKSIAIDSEPLEIENPKIESEIEALADNFSAEYAEETADIMGYSLEETIKEIVLDDLSDEELASLTQNMENDIYLELYN